MTYAEKLKDPRWQKKRLEILSRDEFMCHICSNDKETLHVHHKTYVLGRNPWEYPNCNLITLCETCHGMEEDFKNHYDEIVADLLINYDLNYFVLYRHLEELKESMKAPLAV